MNSIQTQSESSQPDRPNGKPWLDRSPALRSELGIELRQLSDRLVAVIEDPLRSRFFQIGYREYQFIMLLDGRRSIDEIVEAMQQDRGDQDFTADMASKICDWLSSVHLFDSPSLNRTQHLRRAAQAKANQNKLGVLNPISFRLNLLNPDRILKKVTPVAKHFFSGWMFCIWLLLGGYAWSIVVGDYDRFCDSSAGFWATDRWVWLIAVWAGLKVLHEMAHGVACQKYGGEVPEAGVLLILFAPLAFVNVTSSWRFSSRWQRMVVSAAGMYIELLIAFLAVIVWGQASSPWITDLCYQIVIMAGISTLLFNANPLLRFDGYYLLSDLLGIVNLYGKGSAWFGDRIRHFTFGFPLDNAICGKRELPFVAAYGLCSFVWRIVLSVSLLLVASTLFGGIGLILAVIGGIFWIWLPLKSFLGKILVAANKTPIDRLRFSCVATGFITVILVCFYGLKAPEISRAPAIVQFHDERMIRAASSGFVRELEVQNGQSVSEGQRLLVIENPDLNHDLNSLRQAREVATIQARIHGQRNEISLQQAEFANIKSLDEQISEMETKVAQLQILAPFDGVVFRRGLANLDGSYVQQGEVLMHFADPSKKQVLMSIDEEQFKAVEINIKAPVRFVFHGVELVRSNIDSIEPQASDIPIDPSMIAPSGGPLAVQQRDALDRASSDEEFRLVRPQFVGKSELQPAISKRLKAGQLGTAFLYGRRVSLGGYFVLHFKNWIRTTLKVGQPST